MNSVVLVGRVGRDAEIKYFESGKVKANFSIAVNRWDSKTKSEVADWFNIDVWDKQAEFAGEYVKKVCRSQLTAELLRTNGLTKSQAQTEKISLWLLTA